MLEIYNNYLFKQNDHLLPGGLCTASLNALRSMTKLKYFWRSNQMLTNLQNFIKNITVPFFLSMDVNFSYSCKSEYCYGVPGLKLWTIQRFYKYVRRTDQPRNVGWEQNIY
jgi:hypothetical protein